MARKVADGLFNEATTAVQFAKTRPVNRGESVSHAGWVDDAKDNPHQPRSFLRNMLGICSPPPAAAAPASTETLGTSTEGLEPTPTAESSAGVAPDEPSADGLSAEELAEAIASAVRGAGLDPLLTSSAVPTPACSWTAMERRALGALVITASHNPPEWLGLKIKGPFGGSVDGTFTAAVEQRLAAGGVRVPVAGELKRFDARREHLEGLRTRLNLDAITAGLKAMGLRVIVDPMHGSAAGCVSDLLGSDAENLVSEIRSQRDPLFGGSPPEPLATHLQELIAAVQASGRDGRPAVGIVFDGDGDRVLLVDADLPPGTIISPTPMWNPHPAQTVPAYLFRWAPSSVVGGILASP